MIERKTRNGTKLLVMTRKPMIERKIRNGTKLLATTYKIIRQRRKGKRMKRGSHLRFGGMQLEQRFLCFLVSKQENGRLLRLRTGDFIILTRTIQRKNILLEH